MQKPPGGGYSWGMEDRFWAQLMAPFFAFACLVIGYPITHDVRHKMQDGPLRRFLLNTSWKKRFPLLPLLGLPILAVWGWVVLAVL